MCCFHSSAGVARGPAVPRGSTGSAPDRSEPDLRVRHNVTDDALTQASRQAIDGGDDLAGIRSGLAGGDNRLAGCREQHIAGEHESRTHPVDRAGDHALDAITLGDLTGDIHGKRAGGWPLHARERIRDGGPIQNRQCRRLRQVGTDRFRDCRGERRIPRASGKISDHDALAAGQHAAADQRCGGTDAERARRQVADGAEREQCESTATGQQRVAPGEQALQRSRLAPRLGA
jgi:hypothetical protein